MGSRIDLTGQRFERLVVVEDVGRNKHKQVVWKCQCDCGNETNVVAALLRRGHTKSCGCLQKEKASSNTKKSLVGKVYGKLVVVKDTGKTKVYPNGTKRTLWLCECDCGNQVEVVTSHLTSGGTISCGCEHKKSIKSGEDHYRFNPTLTYNQRVKGRKFINGNSQSMWREKVYKRDNYTCQLCKDRNGNGHRVELVAHHKDGYNWCEEKRFDVTNGVTLCKNCHKEFHRTYGSGDNTKEQFEEYKRNYFSALN